ncbi:hypothetical protein [Faecalibacillus intestinalis]|uniref:hypothetical protein n=1 Tax=Faecalibacillus intestinalis TaxID=1982626 RepID=UPI00352283A8
MQLTETVKLYPNKYQTELIKATMTEYISTVNQLVLDAVNGRAITKMTTADVKAASSKCLMQSMYPRCQVHHKKI